MSRKDFFIALLLSSILLTGSLAFAQEVHHKKHEEESQSGHSHAKAEIHGGEVTMTKQHHFEVVWMPDHVMVYLYDKNQNPLPVNGVTGEVTFKFKDGKEQKAELTVMDARKMKQMHHDESKAEMREHAHGKMTEEQMKAMHERMSDQEHFMASVAVGDAKEGEVKATFTLKGLPGKGESEATFTSKNKMMVMPHTEDEHQDEHQHHDGNVHQP